MDFELVKKIVCRLEAISRYAKNIHYNSKGKSFYENYLFAEYLSDEETNLSFKDEILELVFLGRGRDAPSSRELESGVLVLMPESKKNEEEDYKLLRGMIIACLEDIESLKQLSLGEDDLFGRIASKLQRHNGLLFSTLRYSEEEKVSNSTSEEAAWKYLMNSDDDIKEWITVKGNHIPIKKGQTKEEAVKSFLDEKKKKDESSQYEGLGSDEKKVFDSASKDEPDITKDIVSEAKKQGVENAGLDFRKKSVKRAIEKAETDKKEKGYKTTAEALENMYDLVRYTQLGTVENMTETAKKTLKNLKSKGYIINKVKNFFNDKENPYCGVNVQMLSPKGTKFELQFNTKKNIDVKEKMHKIYEKQRVDGISEKEKKEYDRQMWALAPEYEYPKGIEKLVKNFIDI